MPNPSFENYNNLPCDWTSPPNGLNGMLNYWRQPTDGTSDIFNSIVNPGCVLHCNSTSQNAIGHQDPHSGNVMAGIFTSSGSDVLPNFREYISVKLNDPLIEGHLYYAEMYVSLPESSGLKNNNLGMCFTVDSVYQPIKTSLDTLVPQVNELNIIDNTSDWHKVCGYFYASGEYNYLNIGNFFADTNTLISTNTNFSNYIDFGYYFIDDVKVVDMYCTPIVQEDSIICRGDTATLFADSNTFLGWAYKENPDSIISYDNQLDVFPMKTTDYYLYSLCDTQIVTVTVKNISVQLGEDTTICEDEFITLVTATGANVDLYWQDSSTNSHFTVYEPGIYWVMASNDMCNASDSVEIFQIDCDTIKEVVELVIPNIFTPNDDESNDVFQPIKMSGIKYMETSVYNRWGKLVFNTKDLNIGWKAIGVNDGLYYWEVKYIDVYEEGRMKKGFVEISR